MTVTTEALLYVLALFVGILAFVEAGYRLGIWRARRHPGQQIVGHAVVEGAVFSLFGLLLAFIFSSATARYDHRRDLILQEANAIGTAYLRLDLLPAESQPALRGLFRQYLDSRLTMYQKYEDAAEARQEFARSLHLQQQIWQSATAASLALGNPGVISLVGSALSEMIDITNSRLVAARSHPPGVTYLMIFLLSLACAALVGRGMSASGMRPWFHILLFALAISVTVYVILDIEYPRYGVVRIAAADQSLMELRRSMNP